MYGKMTIKEFYKKYDNEIESAIKRSLKEDKTFSDITTKILLSGVDDKIVTAKLLCKQNCIIAGLDIFKKVYLNINPNIRFKFYKKDGSFIRNKQIAAEVKSTLSNLLIGERTALNFLQRMSGIATLTGKFVKKLKYKGSKILHTRKTTPNFRVFELAAVKIGGGDFHRLDLSSSLLIKDNHIEAAGSVKKVLEILRKKRIVKSVEIEAKNAREVNDIIRFGKGLVNVIMLDNFKSNTLTTAINKLKENGFKVEISGGINEGNFSLKQRNGIDFYSIGMLTHSYKSIDFSLEF